MTGTSSTLDGEANLTFDGSNLGVGTGTPIRTLDVSGNYGFVHNTITELSASGGYGDMVTFGTGTVATFSAYFLNSSTAWTLTDADTAATATGMITIALGATISAGMVTRGYVRNTAWSWTVGGAIYLSSTAGALSQTAPTLTNRIIRIVGFAIATDSIYWCPDNTWVEI